MANPPPAAYSLVTPAAVPLLRHQLSIPTMDRVWPYERTKLQQKLMAEDFSLDGQTAPLVVAKKNAFCAQLLFKHPILCFQILDDSLLVAVDPTRPGLGAAITMVARLISFGIQCRSYVKKSSIKPLRSRVNPERRWSVGNAAAIFKQPWYNYLHFG